MDGEELGVSGIVAEDFLEIIYGKRPGWIDLPAKVGDYWVPWNYRWDGGDDSEISARIDDCIDSGESLYFSAAQFKRRKRREEDFMSSPWLWADLDEVHPIEAVQKGLDPTLAWASSDGRYQAMWELDARLPAGMHDKVNQALTYFLGADRGGWDLTQVLRLPGTRNFKYKPAPLVELLWFHEDKVYGPKEIWAKVKEAYHEETRRSAARTVNAGKRGVMPTKIQQLLKVKPNRVVEGERSEVLWKIECSLAELGWGEDAIYEVVSECAWNKWAGKRTGEQRLRREIRKAVLKVISRPTATDADGDDSGGTETVELDSGEVKETAPSPFIRYPTFIAMEMEDPRWLVEDIWTAGGHGIIGGEPKTMKSTLALALGISVASGRDFLNRYPVHMPGPVLMIQEENAPWNMQDRMRKIAASYGLFPKEEAKIVPAPEGSIGSWSVELQMPHDIPFYILNNYQFGLDDPEHWEMLWNEVLYLKPSLVILDPMYLMFGSADFDRAGEVKPFLQKLLMMRMQFDCAIALIHHMRKARPTEVTRLGQRMLGTTTFHGWAASSLYCEKLDEGQGTVRLKIEREFREQGPRKPLDVDLHIGEPGDLEFDATVHDWSATRELIELVTADNDGITANQAMKELGWDSKHKVLEAARDAGMEIVEKQYANGTGHKLYLNGDGEE